MGNREPLCIVTKGGRVVSGAVLKEYEYKDSRQITDPFSEGQYGGMNLVTPPYNLDQLAMLPELNTYHSNCITAKAQDTAGLGWEIKTAEDFRGEASTAQYDDLYGVLSNQWPTLTETLKRVMTDYDTIGNGYLECIRIVPDGPTLWFYHIPGQTIRVHKSQDKYCQMRGVKKRWFKRFGYDKDVNKNDGKEAPLGTLDPNVQASELIQFATFTSRSQYYGVPEGITALAAVVGSRAAQEYNIKFFQNFGVPAYAVYISGDYDLGEKDANGDYALVKQVQDYFDNLRKEPHSTLILGVPSEAGGQVNVEIKPLAVEIKDASFRLYRKDNRDEVIHAHRVPPYRVGIHETGTLGGSNAGEADDIYIESVINPRQEMIEQHFDHLILPTLELTDWRFQLKEMDTRREEHDQEVADFMFRNGAMKPNDLIRFFGKRFGVEPDEDNPALEAYYISGQRMDGETPREQALVKSIKSLHDRLVDVVTKDA